jgi:hypothetical protein
MRRPAALAVTTAVLAIMVPTGAAVADEGDPTLPAESAATTESTTEASTDASTEPVEAAPSDAAPITADPTDPTTLPQQPAEPATTPQTVAATETAPVQEPVQAPVQEPVAEAPADHDAPVSALGATSDEDPGYEFSGYVVRGVVGDPEDGGYAEVGRKLSVTAPDWLPEGTTVTYTWEVGGFPVETGDTYIPRESDVNQSIGLTIDPHFPDENTSGGGFITVAETTKPASVPTNPNNPTTPTTPDPVDQGFETDGLVFRGISGLGGTATAGTPITITPTDAWPAGTTFTFWWHAQDTGVQTPAPSYTPTAADAGHPIHVEVERFENNVFLGSSWVLVATEVVDPDALPEMKDAFLQVTGFERVNPTLGTPLTVKADNVPQGSTFAYTWTVDGQVRGDEVTFTPQAADLGKFLSVDVVVRHEGYQDLTFHQHFDVVVTTPTVTVGAASVLVGQEATVTVSVAGPQGAVTPAGTAKISLTSRATGEVRTFHGVELDHGVATFAVPGLSVGLWDVTAWYQPQQVWSFASLGSGAISFQSEYVEAEGHGTVDVRRATAVLTAPTQLSVPVATRAVVQAQVTAKGATFGTSWTIREGGTVLASGEVGADGKINATLPVLAIGTHTLLLEVAPGKQTTAVSGALTVVVNGEPVQVGGTPTADLETPKEATAPGQEMELVAEGFQPGETVAFYLHSDPVFLGTAVADANGIARLMAWIPADVPAGAHTVVATGGTSGRWANLAVDLAVPVDATAVTTPVAAAAAPAAPAAAADPTSVPAATGDLAVTGSQSGVLMTGAWLMLLVGGGLVVLARKVRALR